MFTVPPAIRAQRLATCKACKHFKSITHSCGTLVVGRKLTEEELAEAEENNQITHYRKKTRLCGCFIPEKSKWSLERCPINKWGYYRLNEEEARELAAFISGLPTDGKLSGVTVRLAADWVYKMTGRRVSCASCNAKALINYLRSETGRLED
jgi:hypothetical protein